MKQSCITTLLILLFFSCLIGWGKQQIVPASLADSREYSYACNFLNKYASLLSSPSTELVNDSIRKVKESGFQYVVGNDAALRKLDGSENFSISFIDGLYRASWSINGVPKVECTFPANIGLLTFANKIELEDRMTKRLTCREDSVPSISLPRKPKEELKPVALSNFFTDDKGFYITPRLRHQVVFKSDSIVGEQCSLLIDSIRYQLESIANMMLTGYSQFPQNLNVRLSKYGYKENRVSVPLEALFSFLSSEGSTPYWGVDTFDGKTVNGLYVWINRQGGFAHMLSVTVPVDVLKESHEIDAKLHCYLRLDNLKSLFEEYPEL